jgi:hypothetical protein
LIAFSDDTDGDKGLNNRLFSHLTI